MMLKKIYGAALIGTKGVLVRCEADVEQGFPTITFIGSLAASVREAADRVRTALGNSGFHLEPRRVTLNLSPAELRKEGCAYDLPIAVSLLAAYGELPENLLTDTLFAGELSLSGEILPVRGVLSMVRCAAAAGLKRCFLPLENLREGSVIGGIDCYGVSTLAELSALLRGRTPLPEPAVFSEESLPLEETPDFSDLAGQELVKRATLLAAGGRHNILYIGPAGTGKSMIASRLPYILPAMSREERLSVSEIYSISGLLPPDRPLMTKRPYRSPHHTVTGLALSGGGQKPRPGEISLAHEGVLFLDELPEYHAATLEVLRQPLEE
ncbi:MAG: YifB family Mg chelatase-like AAA ATPase, partial [Stomatobaculum longum]